MPTMETVRINAPVSNQYVRTCGLNAAWRRTASSPMWSSGSAMATSVIATSPVQTTCGRATLLGEHDPQLPQCIHHGPRLQPPKAPHKPMLVNCSDLIQGDEAGPALKPARRSPRVGLSAASHRGNDDRPKLLVQLVRRDDQARPRLPDLTASGGTQPDQMDFAPLHTRQELPLPLLIVEGSGLRRIEKPVVLKRAHLPSGIGPTATSLMARFGSRHHKPAGLGSNSHLLTEIRRLQESLGHSHPAVGTELHDARRGGHIRECSPASSACGASS